MALGIRQIILAAIAVVVMVIMGTIASDVINQANATVALGCLVPYICPDTAYAAGQYIIYFEGNKALGTSGTFKWMFLDIGEYDKLKCKLTYKEPGGAEVDMDCSQADYVDNFYVMEYDFLNVRDYTVALYAFDKDEELEKREVILEYATGFDPDSVTSFVGLNKRMVYGIIKYDSTNDIPDYALHKDLMVVGFNNAHTWERCGGTDRITQPDECRGRACLCLCWRARSKFCNQERMCFGYDEVEGFVSDFGGLMYGDKVSYYGVDTNYLALLGDCGNFWPFSKDAWFQTQKAVHAEKYYRYPPGDEGNQDKALLFVKITYYEVG